jgi:acetyltransferase-like isoleucine patch superfamily enzyme
MSEHTLAIRIGAFVAMLRHRTSILWRLEAKFKGVEFQGRVLFQGRPIISVAPRARVVIGDNVCIASAKRANPLGLAQPSVLRALAPGASLVLGPGVGISGTVLGAGLAIEIGEQTIMGAGAMVIDNDFHVASGEFGWREEHRSNARPVKIGRGVFVGARAIILKGVTIGDRAVIAAGAVVARDVPAGQLAIGNPARVFHRG